MLNDLASPEYYVVPKADVAKHVSESHQRWLRTPGRQGQPHVDTDMRKFEDPERRYRDRWELLGLDSVAEVRELDAK